MLAGHGGCEGAAAFHISYRLLDAHGQINSQWSTNSMLSVAQFVRDMCPRVALPGQRPLDSTVEGFRGGGRPHILVLGSRAARAARSMLTP